MQKYKLDPTPWVEGGDPFDVRTPRYATLGETEYKVYFVPRPEFEQDASKYGF